VELPVSQTPSPAGEGSVIANAQCLICHSGGMILRQPARTQEQWKENINKMRSSYGPLLPAEQVDALASTASPTASDGEMRGIQGIATCCECRPDSRWKCRRRDLDGGLSVNYRFLRLL
jgi:hypothetical protein